MVHKHKKGNKIVQGDIFTSFISQINWFIGYNHLIQWIYRKRTLVEISFDTKTDAYNFSKTYNQLNLLLTFPNLIIQMFIILLFGDNNIDSFFWFDPS